MSLNLVVWDLGWGWHGLQAVGLEMLDSVRTRKMNIEAREWELGAGSLGTYDGLGNTGKENTG